MYKKKEASIRSIIKEINSDIKTSTFKQIYLLCGDENYLKNNYKKTLIKAMTGDDGMNTRVFTKDDIDEGAFVDAVQTLPFLADRRLVVCEDTGWFKKTSERALKAFESMPETTHIIFVESEIDKRSRMYKKIKDRGAVYEMNHPDSAYLSEFALGRIAREDKKIRTRDMEYFLAHIGNDMYNVINEIDKLVSYVGVREIIDREDIDVVTSKQIDDDIFEMVRLAAIGDVQKALRMYEELLSLKEAPIKILILIERQFAQMLEVVAKRNRGDSIDSIAKDMGLAPFIARKLAEQARIFDVKTLKEKLQYALDIDKYIKSGIISDKLGVEVLITTGLKQHEEY